MTKSPNGIYMPGNEELSAIKVTYPDATLEKLKEGHSLYTTGACIRCHGPKNIYNRGEAQWKNIMDDMALRAHLTPSEKEAVTQYVLSIKATQSK
jgi:mono/diheme cytochrome c family protein